jgi:hypothetical protein
MIDLKHIVDYEKNQTCLVTGCLHEEREYGYCISHYRQSRIIRRHRIAGELVARLIAPLTRFLTLSVK